MTSDKRRPTILICDDEAPILRVSQLKFEMAGFRVMTASDGDEGWRQIEQTTPNIVVTDYQMPGVDGLQMIQRIRSYEPLAQMPIILLTGKGLELSKTLAEQHNLAAVLNKPFSPRELLQRVEKVLAESDFEPQSLVEANA